MCILFLENAYVWSAVGWMHVETEMGGNGEMRMGWGKGGGEAGADRFIQKLHTDRQSWRHSIGGVGMRVVRQILSPFNSLYLAFFLFSSLRWVSQSCSRCFCFIFLYFVSRRFLAFSFYLFIAWFNTSIFCFFVFFSFRSFLQIALVLLFFPMPLQG